MELSKDLIERFNAKYVESDGCWLWAASVAGKGYGQIKLPRERKQIYAHILSYLIHKGPIGEGQYVCHTCDVPRCVNPAHLFLGTPKENLQDMKRKNRHLAGEKNAQAKLTERQVRQIKAMLVAGVSQTNVAAVFGVHQVHISRINRGLSWAHIA